MVYVCSLPFTQHPREEYARTCVHTAAETPAFFLYSCWTFDPQWLITVQYWITATPTFHLAVDTGRTRTLPFSAVLGSSLCHSHTHPIGLNLVIKPVLDKHRLRKNSTYLAMCLTSRMMAERMLDKEQLCDKIFQ